MTITLRMNKQLIRMIRRRNKQLISYNKRKDFFQMMDSILEYIPHLIKMRLSNRMKKKRRINRKETRITVRIKKGIKIKTKINKEETQLNNNCHIQYPISSQIHKHQ